MRTGKQAALRVESLESLMLLSTVAGATGLGSVGSVTVADVQALQQDGSGGALEQFISQVEALNGGRANVKAYARSVIDNHQVTNFDLSNTAAAVGVSVGSGIDGPSEARSAQKMIAAVRSGNIDKTYLAIMKQINAQDVASDQQLINTTQSAAVKAYAQETLSYDSGHLQGAQQLINKPKSTYTPVVAGPVVGGTGALAASDAQALQMDLSGGSLEQFISQVEEFNGSRNDVTQYAQTVVGDHQVTNFDLLSTAGTSGTPLTAGITDSSDIQDAKKVLAATRRGNLDRTYLTVMQRINAQDIAADQQLIASTPSAAVRAYAQETQSYDMTHLQGAQQLLSSQGDTYTAG